jgi:UrcA family protein
MKTRFVFVAAAAASLGFSIAQAGTPLGVSFDQRSETVHFADLDTSRAQGAATLYQRIRSAASRVCHDLEPSRMLTLTQPYASCLRTAIGNAVAEVNRPAVTAYASAHGIKSSPAVQIARNP